MMGIYTPATLAGRAKQPYINGEIHAAQFTLSRETVMSDVMNDRQKGEERKYQMDQELEFKAEARRNKLLGQWLAGEFGMGPAETEEYAKEVVIADLDGPGIEDVMRKVMADIEAKGSDVSEDAVRAKISELNAVAIQQIQDEG